MKKTSFYISILFTTLFCWSCQQEKRVDEVIDIETVQKSKHPFVVKTASLSSAKSLSNISATGIVMSDQIAKPAFKTGGIIQTISIKEGQDVSKGQTIATIDATELEAGVQQAQQAVEKAKRDLLRVQNLLKDSVATRTQEADAKTGLEVAKQRLEAIQFNRNTTIIKSPISGRVVQKLVNPGEVAGPGMPVAIIQGTASSDWKIEVGLTDAQWATVKIGDEATLEFSAFPNKKIMAKVVERATAANPQTGNFDVSLKPKNINGISFATGLIAKVQFTPKVTSTTAQIQLPLAALARVNGTDAEIFIVENNIAKLKKIKIGAMNNGNVNVDSGLSGNESVILTSVPWLRDGDPINSSD